MVTRRTVVILYAGLAPLASGPSHAAELVVTRARLVDSVHRSEDVGSLLLRDGTVAARGDSTGTSLRAIAPGARVVDLDGSWLLPALVDLRVHAGENRSPGHRDRLEAKGTAQVLAASGVTLYADLHLVEEGRRWRQQRGDGPGLRARPRIAGPVITAIGGRGADHPGAHTVFTEAQALAALDSLLSTEPPPDLLTVILDRRPPHRPLPLPALRRILEAGERRGLPCVVEVGTWDDVSEALGAGARFLCHLPPEPMPDQLAGTISAARPQWIPTLAVALDFRLLIQDETLRASPFLRRAAPASLIDDYGAVRVPQSRFAEGRQMQRTLKANVEKLQALGVRWLAGSDSGSVGTFHGWTLLRELQWWSVMGIESWEILRAATLTSAGVLGERRGFEVGDRADYLVLPRSPSQDVTVLAHPTALVLAGEMADPAGMFGAVLREVTEVEVESPLAKMGRGPLFVIVLAVFTTLLVLRVLVKRAVRQS